MKKVILKVKTWFKSLNINYNLVLAIFLVLCLIFGFVYYTKYKEKQQKENIELQEQAKIDSLIRSSGNHYEKAKVINNSTKKIYEKIDQNEKLDFSDIYTSDPDTIAKDILRYYDK